MKKYEIFEHSADMGIRGYGESIEEAFSNALKALSTLIVENIKWEKISIKDSIYIELKAEYLDELFVNFINKVLTHFYLEKILFVEFRGSIKKEKEEYILKGEILGEKSFLERFGYGVEVKGATFTLAEVKKEGNLWIAQCVVDV